MQRELTIRVKRLRLGIKRIEGLLPNRQGVIRIGSLAALEDEHIAEGLTRHFDNDAIAVFKQIGQIVRERVAVPHKALSNAQIGSDMALKAAAPAIDPLTGQPRQNIDGLA